MKILLAIMTLILDITAMFALWDTMPLWSLCCFGCLMLQVGIAYSESKHKLEDE